MRILLIFLLIINSKCAFNQEKQIILKASSTSVNIKLDDLLVNNAWTITPEIKPDIYVTKSKKVTFYTDLDSKEFILKNKEVINFIIVLKFYKDLM